MILLMLSLPSFAAEISTLKSYVEYGKGLSPAFYEDIMKNVKQVESICKTAAQTKEKLLEKLRQQASTEKTTELIKAQIAHTPIAIINNLTSQVEKIKGAKANYQETPLCTLEKMGVWFPNLDKLFGNYAISAQFDYAIHYLQTIIEEIDKIKNYQLKNNDVEFSKVTNTERDIYSFCHKRLNTITREFKYEN